MCLKKKGVHTLNFHICNFIMQFFEIKFNLDCELTRRMLNVPSNLRAVCRVSDAHCNREKASNSLYGVKISSVNLDLCPISRKSIARQAVWVVTVEEVSSGLIQHS